MGVAPNVAKVALDCATSTVKHKPSEACIPMKPTLFDFDAKIRELLEPHHGTLGMVQRHKLLYAVLRQGIGRTGVPPFQATVAAWPMGPVILELHNDPEHGGDPDALSKDQSDACAIVAARLGGIPGKRLAERSHRHYPEWRIARQGLTRSKKGNRIISTHLIRSVTYEQLRVENGCIIFWPGSDPKLTARQLEEVVIAPKAYL
jgi:uncharacterized phage-associated protein